jgi:hypothetical protein
MWYLNSRDAAFGYRCLDNNKATTSFDVMENQLFLKCRNKYHNDTLLLYVTYRDCGRLFYPGEGYHLPKINSLFAKCYVKGGLLHIIYVPKNFKSYIKPLELPNILYRK